MINVLTAVVVWREKKLPSLKRQRDGGAKLTIIIALQHLDLLLVVGATEKLALLNDELIALLESHAAHHADKAFQMEHIVDCSHHQLVAANFLRTSEAAILHEESLMCGYHMCMSGVVRERERTQISNGNVSSGIDVGAYEED
jgi:hypothetical protein